MTSAEALEILKNAPAVMPAVAFHKFIAPGEWIEIFHPSSIGFFGAHEVVVGIKNILVIQGTLTELIDFIGRLFQ